MRSSPLAPSVSFSLVYVSHCWVTAVDLFLLLTVRRDKESNTEVQHITHLHPVIRDLFFFSEGRESNHIQVHILIVPQFRRKEALCDQSTCSS